jgi:glycogen phosphorylase
VTVEVLYGRAGDDDEISDPVRGELVLEEPPGPDSVAWYCGEAVLGQPGPFGYTVRVLPRNPLLASPAEMGLVTTPVAPGGMDTGDLR